MNLKNKKIIAISLLAFIFIFSLSIQSVLATAGTGSETAGTGSETAGTGGGAGSVPLHNPIAGGDNPDINLIIGKAINGVLGIVGSLALVMVIYGGLTWMLAAGNQTRVQKGRDILIWAVVGLVVIFSAYAIVRFIFVNVFGASDT